MTEIVMIFGILILLLIVGGIILFVKIDYLNDKFKDSQRDLASYKKFIEDALYSNKNYINQTNQDLGNLTTKLGYNFVDIPAKPEKRVIKSIEELKQNPELDGLEEM